MSIRPFRDIKRKFTKEISVGKVKIGGNNPISVQSMTNTLTKDVKNTINQINRISEATVSKNMTKIVNVSKIVCIVKKFGVGSDKIPKELLLREVIKHQERSEALRKSTRRIVVIECEREI